MDEVLRILLVEDDPGQARLVRELLVSPRQQFHVTWVEKISAAAAELSRREFDAILLDLTLPDSQGLETVGQANRLAPATPIIVMTGLDDESLAIEALRIGAQDYLVKGQMETRLLVRSLHYSLERKQAQERLERMVVELQQSRDLLEHRVQERTADLASTVTALQAEVTDRRRAEAALRENQQYLHKVLMGCPLILWAVDGGGVITVLEGKALGGLGLKSAELIGKSVLDNRLSLGRIGKCIERALAGEEVLAEFPFASTILESRFSPLLGDRGQIVGAIGVSMDISDRRRLEQEVLEISSQERQHIGQDLHDALGQTLTGLSFLAKVLQRKLQAKGITEQQDAAELTKLATMAISQTRSLARGLCPVDLKAEGLMTALVEMAVNSENILGSRCRFDCPANVLIKDTTTATHLYHIAQEALSNAVKHGRAKNVLIRLAENDHTVTLSIADDGSGLPGQPHRGSGMGLKIMDYRARVIGGNLSIQPGAERGTVITCTLRRGPRT